MSLCSTVRWVPVPAVERGVSGEERWGERWKSIPLTSVAESSAE